MTTDIELAMFSTEQVEALARRGVPLARALAAGVVPVDHQDQLPEGCPSYWTVESGYLPGLLIPWVAEDGRTEYQIRPDTPPVDNAGRAVKYATRGRADGYEPVLWVARRGEPDGVRLITEGTIQTLAASIYAPDGAWVLGIVGCRGWMDAGTPVVDLNLVAGADVVICLDADMWTNRGVWDAGQVLQQAVRMEDARSVRFLQLPAGRKTGLDDLLGSREEARRGAYLANLIKEAKEERFPASRAPKMKKSERAALAMEAGDDAEGSPYIGPGGLLVKQFSAAVYQQAPAALTQEGTVALYNNGVFHIDPLGFTEVVGRLLGDQYRREHRNTTEEFMAGVLYGAGIRIPEMASRPLLNCRNGMLDLVTGELLDHSPDHLSTFQVNLDWDPAATAPFYEEWIRERCGDQVDDLEETLASMLDPSSRPEKAAFLFGKARSGKSTVLRVAREIAGGRFTAGVSLDQLSEDRFAAANLYGMRLNVVGEVAASHVEDISLFKKMTGADLIHANRKHGNQFSFTNQALFVFSANTLPTVGEGSTAYTARIRPFAFPNTYEGAEDPEVEKRVLAELPGILVRWVAAFRRRKARGSWLPTSVQVAEEFARKSDRVRLFVDEVCTVGEDSFSTATELTQAFKVWAEANGHRPIGRNKLVERLAHVPGVAETRDKARRRGYNLNVRKAGDWGFMEVETPGHSGQFVTHCRETEKSEEKEVLEVSVFTGRGKWLGSAQNADNCPPADWAAILRTAYDPTPGELECNECAGQRATVGPAHLWYACPSCHPGSFARA